MAPFVARAAPAKVLEVGAGTGAITRHLGTEMGPKDELTVCEMQPSLAKHLKRNVFALPQFRAPVSENRLRLFAYPVQQIEPTERFDYIIVGLPFTAFRPDDVAEILGVLRRMLRASGVLSYFEYVGLRTLRRIGSFGAASNRTARVSAILDEHIARYQTGRKTIIANIPPAYARYWQFS